MSDPVRTAEAVVRAESTRLMRAEAGECLYCYVVRMLDAFGCRRELHWALQYRDQRARRATALERRLSARGAFCDCEIFLNGFADLRPALWVLVSDCEGWGDFEDCHRDCFGQCGEPRWPVPRVPCAGVRAGTVRECTNWVVGRRRRLVP